MMKNGNFFLFDRYLWRKPVIYLKGALLSFFKDEGKFLVVDSYKIFEIRKLLMNIAHHFLN